MSIDFRLMLFDVAWLGKSRFATVKDVVSALVGKDVELAACYAAWSKDASCPAPSETGDFVKMVVALDPGFRFHRRGDGNVAFTRRLAGGL